MTSGKGFSCLSDLIIVDLVEKIQEKNTITNAIGVLDIPVSP